MRQLVIGNGDFMASIICVIDARLIYMAKNSLETLLVGILHRGPQVMAL